LELTWFRQVETSALSRRKHFFTHHALGFTLGRFAAAHQLGYAQCDHVIAF